MEMLFKAFLALVCGWIAAFGPAGMSMIGKAFLVTTREARQLNETLKLREEQGGIAGKNVIEWTIKPNGEWTVARFLVDERGKERPNSRKETTGKLTPDLLAGLAKEVKAHDPTKLPARLGEPPRVNPHRYVLSYGNSQVVLEGVGRRADREKLKDNILKAAPPQKEKAEPWHQFGELAEAIESRTR